MTYEVELKFPLDDRNAMAVRLSELGAEPQREVEQRDRYFNHPVRDFARTDEALRVRTVCDDQGARSHVTYKGPVVDARAKVRREIEVAVGRTPEDGQHFAEMLALLGFREVRTVVKRRTVYPFRWENRELELALDEFAELGPFLEIETLADESDRQAARDSLLRLAERLGLSNPQRKSYLCLLLEHDRAKLSSP